MNSDDCPGQDEYTQAIINVDNQDFLLSMSQADVRMFDSQRPSLDTDYRIREDG